MKAKDILSKLNLQNHIVWTDLNTLLIRKCRDQDYKKSLEALQKQLDTMEGTQLRDFLQFVQEWSCKNDINPK